MKAFLLAALVGFTPPMPQVDQTPINSINHEIVEIFHEVGDAGWLNHELMLLMEKRIDELSSPPGKYWFPTLPKKEKQHAPI